MTAFPPRAIPIILDCDPGHDDALAIALALARPELEVLGITTVGGNAPLHETTRNAQRVLALLGREDVPVAAGAANPLVRPLEIAEEVHGESGLDGADLPEPTAALRPEGAIEFLRTTLERAPAPVTLVPTGPLTNIAMLLRAYPWLREQIAHVCLMGGAMHEGNWTPAAEFNIWVDPEAARLVFRSGVPLTMVGLDVTHRALFREPDIERLEAVGTHPARVFADLLRFFAQFHRRRYGWDGSPIHDAVAVAHLAVPGLVGTRRYHVDVETQGDITRGRTVVDHRGVPGPDPNCDVALTIDRERFVNLLVDAVASFD
ncbi:MAG TPA: nucleoside hydrolase [Candidatus Limnocylindrales bacterium]|nr:nucleoside hydrolase [Candidatus Limnocylindrales bacterium]